MPDDKNPELQVNVEDKITVHGDLSYKHMRGGKLIGKGKAGTELHHDSGTYQQRERHFKLDRPDEEGSYIEKIVNPALGVVISKVEKLREHWGRGSARK